MVLTQSGSSVRALQNTGQVTKLLCFHSMKLDRSNSFPCKGITRTTTLAAVTYSILTRTQYSYCNGNGLSFHKAADSKPVSETIVNLERKLEYRVCKLRTDVTEFLPMSAMRLGRLLSFLTFLVLLCPKFPSTEKQGQCLTSLNCNTKYTYSCIKFNF